MEKQKELLEVFEKLNQENQVDILAYIRGAYVAQNNFMRRYKKPQSITVPICADIPPLETGKGA